MKKPGEDETALKKRVATELAIAFDSLSKVTCGSVTDDGIWRANAHTELAIGILKLLLDETTIRGQRTNQERSFRVLDKASTAAKYEKIKELLQSAAQDLRDEKLGKCLSEMRNARDMLTSSLVGEKRK